MRVRESVAVVTGASGGIGRAVALALARRGAAVALVARRTEALEELAREIRAAGTRALVVGCDVADAEQVAKAAERVERELGWVSILVNAAGLGIWRSFAAVSDAEHREMMAVNYWGTFHWIRALLPGMRERRRGAIVNLIGGTGKFALAVTSGYSASKFAVAGLSEALRRELGGSGVSVTSLYPGSVRTGFWNADRVESRDLPPLVRYAPKISPEAVARGVVQAVRLGLAERFLPVFVGVPARLSGFATRLGDLVLWPWFFPALVALLVARQLLMR